MRIVHGTCTGEIFGPKTYSTNQALKGAACRQRQSLATSHVRILSSIEGLWLGPGCSDFADGEKHGEYIARRWLIAKREHVSVALKRKKPASGLYHEQTSSQ
jgi:hypothetical protein